MEVPAPLARYRRDVDAFLRSFLDREGCPELYRMARYHMGWENEAGGPAENVGKGLRPALLLLACEAAGGDWRRAVPAAGAVELVHNFSLIHDDIQDRDRERHGRPTVWAVWGEAQAINAGDALLALARLALLRLHDEGLPPPTVVGAARALDRGTLEMVEGQVMDLAFEGAEAIALGDYQIMISKKTGALFGCSLEIGALAAGCEGAAAETLGRAGRLLGCAFQIRDDMLGIWGAESRTGKEAAADIRRRKKSLPVVYALNSGDETAAECVARAYRKPEMSDDDVSMVLRALDSIGAQAYCTRLAEEQAAKAVALLDDPALAGVNTAELKDTARFLLERDY